jgi:hypothetical protein
MARLLPLLLMIHLALLTAALYDCLAADERAVRALPRGTWVFVILLTAPVGAIAWFVRGQPAPAVRLADGSVLLPGCRARGRVALGPDDDPEFLRSLATDLRRRAEGG